MRSKKDWHAVFGRDVLQALFPAERADRFFDALFGDAAEGAYDIRLRFSGASGDRLEFEFHLIQRPGKCIDCSLTYGLPQVFARHPVIDIKGLVQDVGRLLTGAATCTGWRLGRTREVNSGLHIIPLHLELEDLPADSTSG